MDYLETLATLGTQDTVQKKSTSQNIKKMNHMAIAVAEQRMG